MTVFEKSQAAAKLVNGTISEGLSSFIFNYELKREQTRVYFNRRAKAEKAILILKKSGYDVLPTIARTPSFINVYFKFSISILF